MRQLSTLLVGSFCNSQWREFKHNVSQWDSSAAFLMELSPSNYLRVMFACIIYVISYRFFSPSLNYVISQIKGKLIWTHAYVTIPFELALWPDSQKWPTFSLIHQSTEPGDFRMTCFDAAVTILFSLTICCRLIFLSRDLKLTLVLVM